MPQINCRPDGNVPAALHQNRYYSPIVEGDFEFVSFECIHYSTIQYVEKEEITFYNGINFTKIGKDNFN